MASLLFDELPFGFSWTIDEPMQRTSHALLDESTGVWLVDPTDEAEALERAAALGSPAGVIQLLDRHNRDCAAIATRLGVDHVKAYAGGPAGPFEVIEVLNTRIWKEAALWWREKRVLVVPELVGTAPLWAVGDGAVGVHPAMRVKPPRKIGGFHPEHLLVGHGPGVHGPDAAPELAEALAAARKDLPQMLKALPAVLRGGR